MGEGEGSVEIERELEDLRAWKEEALKVLADWHALGAILLRIAPGKIGDNIPRHLLKRFEELTR